MLSALFLCVVPIFMEIKCAELNNHKITITVFYLLVVRCPLSAYDNVSIERPLAFAASTAAASFIHCNNQLIKSECRKL